MRTDIEGRNIVRKMKYKCNYFARISDFEEHCIYITSYYFEVVISASIAQSRNYVTFHIQKILFVSKKKKKKMLTIWII